MPHRCLSCLSLLFLLLVVLPAVGAEPWTLTNPTDRLYDHAIVRLKLDVPAGEFHITEDGKPVPHHVIERDDRTWIAVATSVEPNASRKYAVVPGPLPGKVKPAVAVTQSEQHVTIDNGRIALRLPRLSGTTAQPPLEAVKWAGGAWVGQGAIQLGQPIKAATTIIVADGSSFALVRQRYELEGKVGVDRTEDAVIEVDFLVAPGVSHAIVRERFESTRGNHWSFDAAAGWGADKGLVKVFGGGAGKGANEKLQTWDLKPGKHDHQPPDTLLWLIPRWNQHYKDGWLFAATDGKHVVGALATQASQWVWPHQNSLEIRVDDSGRKAAITGSLHRGARQWLLHVGTPTPLFDADQPGDVNRSFVQRYAMEPLDKLVHEIITDWPGGKGKFAGEFTYTGNINPTGFWRGMGRRAIADADKTSDSIGQLTRTQLLLHGDAYGTYGNFWSPQNPNFYTDFLKVPLGMGATLRNHPRFDEIRRLAISRLYDDMAYGVTLPSGAGQECPGYLAHSISGWKALAPVMQKHYGVDITKWPQYKAAGRFLLHSSVPVGPSKRLPHPSGDTHNKSDPFQIAESVGYRSDPKSWKTEELEGFGVMFRHRPGTDRETLLSFKAGPNRGHFHGDQLSLHYCHNAQDVAIDHRCSYAPRAGQEHMHNRVSFTAGDFDYANMDGYERLIAFKTADVADVAIGQVESDRLRRVKELPPEDWDVEWPIITFDKPLVYRRTVVFVRGQADMPDYFVLRDQFTADRPVKATFNLHVLDGKAERQGNVVDMGKLKLFVAEPAADDWQFKTLAWSHDKIAQESTTAARLTIEAERGTFITVVYPAGKLPKHDAVAGGVRVGSDVITFAGELDEPTDAVHVTVQRDGKTVLELTGREVDMDRSQGDIGLFVPDAGYPFGDIPDWLIRQRKAPPPMPK